MTRFKNYLYLTVDRKVLKPSSLGLENSCLKVAFCFRVLYFPCLAKLWRRKYLNQARNTWFFYECSFKPLSELFNGYNRLYHLVSAADPLPLKLIILSHLATN